MVSTEQLDVSLNAPEQRRIIVLKQVRGHDHHAVKLIKFLHAHVTVLVDRGGQDSPLASRFEGVREDFASEPASLVHQLIDPLPKLVRVRVIAIAQDHDREVRCQVAVVGGDEAAP